MLTMALVMSGIIVLAALVVVFVAFPHRDRDLPAVPWVGEAMKKGADAMPTLESERGTEGMFFRR